jgi:hypothetical protein
MQGLGYDINTINHPGRNVGGWSYGRNLVVLIGTAARLLTESLVRGWTVVRLVGRSLALMWPYNALKVLDGLLDFNP